MLYGFYFGHRKKVFLLTGAHAWQRNSDDAYSKHTVEVGLSYNSRNPTEEHDGGFRDRARRGLRRVAHQVRGDGEKVE
jgi:hypothetical protein